MAPTWRFCWLLETSHVSRFKNAEILGAKHEKNSSSPMVLFENLDSLEFLLAKTWMMDDDGAGVVNSA